ncbi:unnamed protein product, partial [Discosporangium mesarthrocarpum]
RGPYSKVAGTRLPGVGGRPPHHVCGDTVVITFSANHWKGMAPAGEDHGWRLVCFVGEAGDREGEEGEGGEGPGARLVEEATRAADRAEAVDARNALG